MCGIAGIVANNSSDNSAAVRSMTEAMRHRGPDGEGYAFISPSSSPPGSLGIALEELAQNGVRRETVPDSSEDASRTLCAIQELAQNGARRETVPDSSEDAGPTLCAFENVAYNEGADELVVPH